MVYQHFILEMYKFLELYRICISRDKPMDIALAKLEYNGRLTNQLFFIN